MIGPAVYKQVLLCMNRSCLYENIQLFMGRSGCLGINFAVF